MTRYLKALGLAMMAAFAFSALSAASASAQTQGHITSDSTEVTLRGEENPNGLNAFTAFGSVVTCPETVYTGHATLTQKETEEEKTHQPLHSGETEVTVTPHYKGCHGPNGVGDTRTVDMNGCDYRFYDFTTPDETAGTYTFDIDIGCPAGEEITITEGPCVVHVPPQNGLTGLHATNNPETEDKTIHNNKIGLKGTVTGITAKLPCLGAHTNKAEQHQDVVVEGLDNLGDTTPIRISD